MTVQEAINRTKEVADEKYKEAFLCYANSGDIENDKKNDECVKCAKEHEQLAEWLEEIQQYRAIGTAEECRENKRLLEFLYDTINPNDMESYLSIYNASNEKSD